ncbi:hypothetical protein G5B46_05055 [Caulobacter sp. 602-2]|uniref:Uncharacterized protein n=1 Tax=Caulobacter sp. 602-2 TaxID=2710887 RepID=A0A6G4QU54_9CAUL|nr:hypothetical protein [Caulobacter sp. 602-2]NGM48969.1 hypothetical protein [Caulobacter sp. 602-2]
MTVRRQEPFPPPIHRHPGRSAAESRDPGASDGAFPPPAGGEPARGASPLGPGSAVRYAALRPG